MTAPVPDLWLTDYRISTPPSIDPDQLHARSAAFHRESMSLFGPTRTGHPRAENDVLWRLERRPDESWRLLIQSTSAPTAAAAARPHITVKPIFGLYESLTEGLRVRYTIQVAAQSRQANPKGERGFKDIALTRAQSCDRWTGKFASRAGLALTGAPDVSRIDPQPLSKRTTDPGRFLSDRFTGEATITDPAALTHALRRGIGLRKTYGCGLLSLAVASD